MPLILNIDTATDFASICLSKGNEVLCFNENKDQKNHASFLQLAIKQMMIDVGSSLSNIDAFAVTYGPGSYTGLRVGLASAKGLCFALNKPLITLNTLQVIANSVIENSQHIIKEENNNTLLCPMIDARRMEVFTALYNHSLSEVLPTQAMILNEESFADYLLQNKIIFCGNGSNKFQSVTKNDNAIFNATQYSAKNMVKLSLHSYINKNFADLAYSSPFYAKDFYTTTPKKLL